MKTISVLALVVIMTASASALIVNNTVTWIGKPNTNGTPGTTAGEIKLVDTPISSMLEIGPAGRLTCNNSGGTASSKNGRLTLDGSAKLVLNGGVLNSNSNIVLTGASNIGFYAEIIINSGTLTANKLQNLLWRSDRDGMITLAAPGAVLIVQSGYGSYDGSTGSAEWDPARWEIDGVMRAGTGYTLAYRDLGVIGGLFMPRGGTGVEITVVPEPATLSLLGLGVLAMLRKRK